MNAEAKAQTIEETQDVITKYVNAVSTAHVLDIVYNIWKFKVIKSPTFERDYPELAESAHRIGVNIEALLINLQKRTVDGDNKECAGSAAHSAHSDQARPAKGGESEQP